MHVSRRVKFIEAVSRSRWPRDPNRYTAIPKRGDPDVRIYQVTPTQATRDCFLPRACNRWRDLRYHRRVS